jgi:16S rRNA processing protein RimM
VSASRILLGVIGRPHGVRGLVHVTSHTADPAALAAYGPLSDDKGRRFRLTWNGDGIAALECEQGGHWLRIADRDAAARLTNARLYVDRDALPPPAEEEYYFADLIGLRAVDADGIAIGIVAAVHDYGGGTSLEIAGDHAPLVVPFTRASVPDVDVPGGRITIVPPKELDIAPAAIPATRHTPVREEVAGRGTYKAASPHGPRPPAPSRKGRGRRMVSTVSGTAR